MNETIKVNATDLVACVVAAEIWLKTHNEIFHNLDKELQAVKTLKKELYKTDWDADAELLIIEKPF